MEQSAGGKKAAFFIFLAALPALFLAFHIYKYSVNVIYWDEWEIVSLFEKISKGHLCFGDLFAQQVESRFLLPRVAVLIISYLTRWNVRYEMAFSLFLLCAISVALYWLSRKTVSDKKAPVALLLLAANIVLFSPIQSYNLLTGHQMGVFMPAACLVACVAVTCSGKLGLAGKFLCCMILCILATFSIANGIVSWVLLLPLLIVAGLKDGGSPGKIRILSAAWVACFLLSVWAYFHSYKMPPSQAAPSAWDICIDPAAAVQYFLAFIGSPLFFENASSTAAAGFMAISLWGIIAFALIRRYRTDPAQLYRALAWLTIGAYALLSGALITLGRFGWSRHAPIPPTRYTSFSLFFTLSLVYLCALYFSGTASGVWRYSRLFRPACVIILGVFICMQAQTYRAGIAEMIVLKKDRLRAKAYLLFMNVVEKKSALNKFVYPDMDKKKEAAGYIDMLGYIAPPLIKANTIALMEGDARPGVNYGYLSNLIKNADGTYTASGWARLPEKMRAADAVVLAYSGNENQPVAFELTGDTGRSASYKNPFHQGSVWEISFSADRLPEGEVTITAWAFDADSGKAFRLNNEHSIIAR